MMCKANYNANSILEFNAGLKYKRLWRTFGLYTTTDIYSALLFIYLFYLLLDWLIWKFQKLLKMHMMIDYFSDQTEKAHDDFFKI